MKLAALSGWMQKITDRVACQRAKTHAFQSQLEKGQVNFSVGVIAKFVRKRRYNLYTFVIALRLGMITYCRCMAVPLRVIAANSLMSFLKGAGRPGAEHEGDFLQPMKRYLWRIRLVQRHWKSVRLMREARVDAYEVYWRRVESSVVKAAKLPR